MEILEKNLVLASVFKLSYKIKSTNDSTVKMNVIDNAVIVRIFVKKVLLTR